MRICIFFFIRVFSLFQPEFGQSLPVLAIRQSVIYSIIFRPQDGDELDHMTAGGWPNSGDASAEEPARASSSRLGRGGGAGAGGAPSAAEQQAIRHYVRQLRAACDAGAAPPAPPLSAGQRAFDAHHAALSRFYQGVPWQLGSSG
jgi:hypothetical protein